MKKETYFPFFISPWVKNSKSIVINSITDNVSVGGLSVKAMSKLITLCNGYNTLAFVTARLKESWHEDDVDHLLALFIKNGIIINSRNMNKFLLDVSSNPMPFFSELSSDEVNELVSLARNSSTSLKESVTHRFELNSERMGVLYKLLNKRKSCRKYAGESIHTDLLSSILWSGYGIQSHQNQNSPFHRRTVPSAGALYPIYLSLILFRDCEDVKKGIYNISYSADSVQFSLVSEDLSSYFVTFADPLMLKDAVGIIVIQGSYDRNARKYGNRSMRYLPIEAGHIAQNISLACEEYGLGCLEIGGFREDCLSKLICSQDTYTPIVALAFGVPKKVRGTKLEKDIRTLVRFPKTTDSLAVPYITVYGKQEGVEGYWASGKDAELGIASSKLQSELVEWNAWKFQKQQTKVFSISAVNKIRAIDPRKIVKYHAKQYESKSFKLKPLGENVDYTWVLAEDMQRVGKKVYVLADFAFFPYPSVFSRYSYATSSGYAAHITKYNAIQHAIYELIERDAFMITWMNRLMLPRLDLIDLPDTFQRRYSSIEKLGFRIIVRDISMGIAPVILVSVKSATSDYLTCGLGSSHDITKALESAFSEVETGILHHLQDTKKKKPLKYSDVKTSSDHEQLYRQRQYVKKADFLFDKNGLATSIAEIASKFPAPRVGIVDILSKLQKDGLEVYVIDATDWKREVLASEHRYVVRVIIPGLIPISFGYNQEPFGMDRVYEAPVSLGMISMKNSYSQMNHMPHPLN